MDKQLVSVIIPVYNAEKYLAKTIESAMNQTHRPIEVIIVDDGSTDQSLKIALAYQSEQVKVLSQKNEGASAARNKGLSEAKGDFIQFLDADDLLSTDKIAEQVTLLLANPDKVAVSSTVHFADGKNPQEFKPSTYEQGFLIDTDPAHFLINLWGGYGANGSMVQPNAWLTPAHIIKKSGPWNEGLSLDDDGEYFCRIVINSKGVIKSKGLNYYRKYSIVNDSLSAAFKEKDLLSQIKSLRLRYQHISTHNQSINLKIAYLRSLHQLNFKLYPQYPGILKEITKAIKEVDYELSYKYEFATPKGKVLSNLIGWKQTKKIQLMLQKFR
jgi:glycosyltransferase involved in cell wall biosynthesis